MTSSVKHGVCVWAWACVSANGAGSLTFTDDFTADGGNVIFPPNVKDEALDCLRVCPSNNL